MMRQCFKQLVTVFAYVAGFAVAGAVNQHSFAQETASPSTQPAAPQAPLRLTDLPNELINRSDDLAKQRQALKSELAAARVAAQVEFTKQVPTWDVLKSTESRTQVAAGVAKCIRELQQIEVEQTIVSPGGNPTDETDPAKMYMARESAMYFAGVLAAVDDAEGAKKLVEHYRLSPDAVSSTAEFLIADANAQQEFLSKLNLQMEDKDLPTSQRAVDVALLIVRRQLASDASVYPSLFEKAKQMASNPLHKASIVRHEMAMRGKDSKAQVGRELTVSGKQPDGSDFSTESLKGKVVLIDFWATWCGPCKAELPKLKETYKKYHDQGFEIVGVSNDYAKQDLERYISSNPDLSWRQLFDPRAAATMQWHPITMNFGIASIPQMYVIDRKGVLRSITGRKDYETLIPQLLAE